MLRIALCSAAALAAGCSDEPDTVDTTLPACAGGAGFEVAVSGRVLDFATRAPLAGAVVGISPSFTNRAFPEQLCAAARTTTRDDGGFGPITVILPGEKPGLFESAFAAMFLREGDRAPIVSDARVGCSSGGCTVEDHVIVSPSLELATAWREELSDGGMDRGRTRGLVMFQYLEPSGTPAAGVHPARWHLLFDQPDIDPGDDVRYLAANRRTLASPGTSSTTSAGIAFVGVDTPDGRLSLVGRRHDEDGWAITGCYSGAGWIFTEDDRRAPPATRRPDGGLGEPLRLPQSEDAEGVRMMIN